MQELRAVIAHKTTALHTMMLTVNTPPEVGNYFTVIALELRQH